MQAELIVEAFVKHLAELVREDRVLLAPTLPLSAEAALVGALARLRGRTVVWITDGPQTLDLAHRDLITLSPSSRDSILCFPAWEAVPGGTPEVSGQRSVVSNAIDPDIGGNRLETLLRIEAQASEKSGSTAMPRPPFIIVTCVQALMQKTLSAAALARHTFSISIGDERDTDSLPQALQAAGYAFTPEVQRKGEACLKGGLLDVWPAASPWPLRIEFMGATVESLRSFNPADQRSVEKLTRVEISPATEWGLLKNAPKNQAAVVSWLPEDTLFVWSNADSVREHASLYEEMVAESRAGEVTVPFSELRSGIGRLPGAVQLSTGTDGAPIPGMLPLDMKPMEGVFDLPREALQPDILETTRQRLLADLHARAAAGQTVVLFFDTPGALGHFRERQPENGIAGLQTVVGALSGGFVSDSLRLAVVAESDLYGRRKTLTRRYDPQGGRPRPERVTGMRVADLTDIEPGDLVVHVEHGVGKYTGLHEILFNGQLQEVLTIEYAEGAKLHVPVSQAHLLSRYVGVSKHRVPLHRLGGKRWNTEKIAADRAIADLASSLLEVQAQRNILEGYAFPPDVPWQHDLEGAFPYQETPDQQRVIVEVKADMESSKPMDRLVCGDAGYGKTEVAMRAAFKAVMAAKQVAVLAPTTVLAQQHFETFRERMSAYPVRIEMLSRFVTRGRQGAIVRSLAEGTVDIVVGTHALLQPGIQFKDLGLVVIDEEQRFGVGHKEKLKEWRRLVDVLTLTATPIPRTLYMSLTGARDMSLLQTPPRERLAIETVVAPNTDKVVRDAILREISREGQVFYLYNRVMTIDLVKKRLERIVPEARMEIAHGQMAAGELSSVMKRFVAGEFEVLLCTTIIESGMDIPRANTILIDRADRFGIADLYQLRGRVGRSRHKAYAYLLLPSHGQIDADARQRIGAVKKYSSLSAGFNLALRDLELRGAGNLLGAAQSGHITAIGFGLYCQLLKAAVARLKGRPVPPIVDVDVRLDFVSLSPDASTPDNSAIIPYPYVEDERLRIAIYRRLAETASLEDVSELSAELKDRYGPIPGPVQRLLCIAKLRVVAARQDIRQVDVRDGRVMLVRNGDYLMKGKRFPRLAGSTPNKQLDELIELVQSVGRWAPADKREAPKE